MAGLLALISTRETTRENVRISEDFLQREKSLPLITPVCGVRHCISNDWRLMTDPCHRSCSEESNVLWRM